MKFPGQSDKAQLHRVQLGVTSFFGASVHDSCHYKPGGLLYGVFEEGEFNTLFDCVVTAPGKKTIIAEYGKDQCAKNCDGDHTWGRDHRFLNNYLYVQEVHHSENITRSWTRRKAGEWLNLFHIGVYDGGNVMPKEFEDRVF